MPLNLYKKKKKKKTSPATGPRLFRTWVHTRERENGKESKPSFHCEGQVEQRGLDGNGRPNPHWLRQKEWRGKVGKSPEAHRWVSIYPLNLKLVTASGHYRLICSDLRQPAGTNVLSGHIVSSWQIYMDAGLRRCGKSCRLRWLNYLRPDIKRGNISDDEEDLIIRLHKLLGNRQALTSFCYFTVTRNVNIIVFFCWTDGPW